MEYQLCEAECAVIVSEVYSACWVLYVLIRLSNAVEKNPPYDRIL